MNSIFNILVQIMAILVLCESRTLYRDVTAEVTFLKRLITLKAIYNRVRSANAYIPLPFYEANLWVFPIAYHR